MKSTWRTACCIMVIFFAEYEYRQFQRRRFLGIESQKMAEKVAVVAWPAPPFTTC